MRRTWVAITGGLASLVALAAASPVNGQVLTVERAVQIALEKSTPAIQAEASVLDARGGLYGSYSGILPHLSANYYRDGRWITHSVGNESFSGVVPPPVHQYDYQAYSTTPQLAATWSVLDLSALSAWRGAGAGLKAAQLNRQASRNDLALSVRRQFYLVVQNIWIARVNTEAARLARDDERRVRSLFEVGSVPRSDLLQAQVRTARAELDSIISHQLVIVLRINLANAIGVREQELGELDTTLTRERQAYDRATLLAEATGSRPDLQAADAEARSASHDLRSANLLRVPYVTVGGAAAFETKSNSSFDVDDGTGRQPTSTRSETDRVLSGRLALNWNIFSGFATEGRIASARARKLRAEDTRDALRRSLESEVDQALLAYNEANERDRVASRARESAEENLNLIQQKYNVGSATILDLIDAQVQLQRSRSDRVTALTLIRAAEAQINRVRGRAE
jgi:outer membrane protein TolC